MKKKALSLFLVTAMAVSMVGCGSKDADKNTDKNTDKKDTEVAAATEKEAAAEDEAWEGDLTVWLSLIHIYAGGRWNPNGIRDSEV